MTSKEELIWLAGIIEGEGCIHIEKLKGYRKTGSIQLKVTMTDRDIVERVANLFGSDVSSRKGAKAHYKQEYTTRVWGEKAVSLIADIFEYLGIRRKQKAIEALNVFSKTWPGDRLLPPSICKHGHAILETSDLYVSKDKTWCKKCKLRKTAQDSVNGGLPHGGNWL